MNAIKSSTLALCLSLGVAHAQFGRGDGGWSTLGGDLQRSGWVRTDPKISTTSLQKPGFQMVWKLKLNNDPRQMNGLTPPPLMDRYIGIKGFRTLGFVGGSSDNIYAVDLDLGRTDWQTHFASSSSQKESTPTCPGGMTANTARSLSAAFPGQPQAGRGGGGGGRGTPAKSAVGEAGRGSVILAEMEARAAAAASGAPPAGRGGGGGGRGGGRRMPVVVDALASDGMLHSMYVSNGVEPEPPVKFLPPNANAQGLTVMDNVAYVFTAGGCGGVPNGLWALDPATKEVTNWKLESGGVAGSAGPAFGPDGTLYVATTGGDLVSLEAKTLKVKDVYRAGQELISSPVIFQNGEKTMIAVAAKDGAIHLLDAASIGTAVFKTAADPKAAAEGALASWQDAAGTRWILTPTASAITAWKVGDRSMERGWVSRDLVSPLPPLILNGVVFAASGGGPRTPAVLYALDGATGKELWSSGKTITSFVHGGGISGGSSQVYLGAHDGTLYAFGFPMEH
jgi:outer membrane protein assembly factor BamB